MSGDAPPRLMALTLTPNEALLITDALQALVKAKPRRREDALHLAKRLITEIDEQNLEAADG